MTVSIKRDVTNFILTLQKFESVRYIIYDYHKVFCHDVEDLYPTFRAKISRFSIFDVYICLLALKRYRILGQPTDFFVEKIEGILEKGALMKSFPVVEEAAGYFYESYPDSKPDRDYKEPFYWLDQKLISLMTYEEFSQKVDFLYEQVFVGCDDFAVDYSHY